MLYMNIYTEKSIEKSLDNDMLLQGKINIVSSIIWPISNIKEEGKMTYPSQVYVIST